jgi:hypothetical protein
MESIGPALVEEVTGSHFASSRQVYGNFALAKCYRERLADSDSQTRLIEVAARARQSLGIRWRSVPERMPRSG